MSYKKDVKKMQRIQVGLVIICILALVVYAFVVTRPEISEYELTDECGPIGGSISHTIADIDECENMCNAYCVSLEKEFHDSIFEQGTLECNSCTCFCKE